MIDVSLIEKAFLMSLWEDLAGLPEKPIRFGLPSLEELKRTQVPQDYINLMLWRMIQGAFRYGLLGDPAKLRYDRVGYIRKKLDLYMEDGNLEHLVDISNVAMCEFYEGHHPKQHFNPIQNGFHGE